MNKYVTTATFGQEVLASPGRTLVDFRADWCMPCHAVEPVLAQVAEERNLKLVRVDYDQEPELAERYGVMSIPNMILFENGVPQAQAIGALRKNALEQELGLA
jgi:thioredoxin 1